MAIERDAFKKGDIDASGGWIHHVHNRSYHARFTYVYKHNNTIKGFICIRPFVNNSEVNAFAKNYEYPINNMGSLISGVYVLPQFRNQNVEQSLYEFAIRNMYSLSALYSEVNAKFKGTKEFQIRMGLSEVGKPATHNMDHEPSTWQLFEIQNTPSLMALN